MNWDDLKPLLDEKLDKRHVKEPDGKSGPKGDYLEGWHVINEANRIFGHGGWGYTIDLRQDDLRTAPDKYGKDQWQAAYTCICTLTVGGVVRQDVGFGSGFAKTIGDAIEGATKEAATDALKRALRTFGNQFGLALYDKARVNVETQTAEPVDHASVKERMVTALGKAETLEALNAIWYHRAANAARAAMPKDVLADIISTYEQSRAALKQRAEQQGVTHD